MFTLSQKRIETTLLGFTKFIPDPAPTLALLSQQSAQVVGVSA